MTLAEYIRLLELLGPDAAELEVWCFDDQAQPGEHAHALPDGWYPGIVNGHVLI